MEADSAGSNPAPRVNPYAIAVLREHGIVWEERTPRHLDAVVAEHFDVVITVCDDARDACPIFPGANAQVHWGMPDPALESDPVRARAAFERTYESLSLRVDAFLDLDFERMSPPDLKQAVQQIHETSG